MQDYFHGKVGDVRIYGRVLTYGEIKWLYWLYRWYYLNWYQRLWMMVKEAWLILTGKEGKGGFDFWWTPYNSVVYSPKAVRGRM